jgi:hypothetical protein
MALGDPYVTLAEFKTRVGIGDTNDDDAITQAVNTASRWIDGHCRRQFNKTTTASARIYYPEHCGLVLVDDFHTTTDLAVKTGTDGTYGTTLTSAQYELHPLNGIVGGESGWPYWKIYTVNTSIPASVGRATVQVTAQWGWNAVPAAVKEACFIVSRETFKLNDTFTGRSGFGEFGEMVLRRAPQALDYLVKYRLDPVLVG